MNKKNMNKKAFTLVELMIIFAIIGILAAVILTLWATSSQNRAAINGYKTSMQSVRTAVEMCTGANGIAQSGKIPGDLICDYNKDGTPDGSERYPKLPKKCGSGPYFCVAPTSGNGWHVSTGTSAGCATSWDCKGCRLDCSTTGCQEIGSCK